MFKLVRRLLQLQLLTVLAAFAVAWAIGGMNTALSALAGGLVAFLPNAVFAVLSGRRKPGKSAQQVVKTFYFGESVKLVLTVALFAAAFHLPGMQPLPLFVAFAAVMAMFWFSLLLSNYQNS